MQDPVERGPGVDRLRPAAAVVDGDARTDVAGAFPGFSNSAAAAGHFIFDWSTLANGPHTIGWLITDDCNRADGVGSRFFNVSGGTSLTAASTGVPSVALRAGETESSLASAIGGTLCPSIFPRRRDRSA